jgi:hypothetical protein
MGMIVQWSDGDSSEGDDNGESAKQVIALTGVHISDVESEEDNVMTYDELEVTYRDLLIEHEQVCWALKKQKRTISQLVAENNVLSGKLSKVHIEVTRLNSQMNELKKQVSQLNPGTDLLEKILEKVPTVRMKSVGFDYKLLNKLQPSQDTKFSPTEEVLDPYTGKMMPQHHTQHPVTYPIPKSFQHHNTHSQKPQHPSQHPVTYPISKPFQHHNAHSKKQKHKKKNTQIMGVSPLWKKGSYQTIMLQVAWIS